MLQRLRPTPSHLAAEAERRRTALLFQVVPESDVEDSDDVVPATDDEKLEENAPVTPPQVPRPVVEPSAPLRQRKHALPFTQVDDWKTKAFNVDWCHVNGERQKVVCEERTNDVLEEQVQDCKVIKRCRSPSYQPELFGASDEEEKWTTDGFQCVRVDGGTGKYFNPEGVRPGFQWPPNPIMQKRHKQWSESSAAQAIDCADNMELRIKNMTPEEEAACEAQGHSNKVVVQVLVSSGVRGAMRHIKAIRDLSYQPSAEPYFHPECPVVAAFSSSAEL